MPCKSLSLRAASGYRPMQANADLYRREQLSSNIHNITPLCSGQYPPAYEVAPALHNRDALKNSNVRSRLFARCYDED
jgi:hypothetical protein